jgi:hypothetical protein
MKRVTMHSKSSPPMIPLARGTIGDGVVRSRAYLVSRPQTIDLDDTA